MEQTSKLKLNSGTLLVFILTVGVFAVSYTHLDVYKRQI